MGDTSAWDIICLQEGILKYPPGLHTEAGLWILSGQESQVGTTHLLLNQRVGSRLRRTKTHTHYVIAEVGLISPVILFSLYLPPFSAHSSASFETTIEHFQKDLQEMHRTLPGSFILGGGDCNTQLSYLKGHVGRHTGTSERACDRDRQDLFLGFLAADMNLKVPSIYADTGPTRMPWPKQHRQQPSKIDFIIASTRLISDPILDDIPTPATNTDHVPVGATVLAPHASRKDRRRQFEELLARQRAHTKIPTHWAPGNEVQSALRVRALELNSLEEVAPKLATAAEAVTAYATEHSKEKRRLLEGIRTAKEGVIRKAYQVHLQVYRREQRETQERNKLLNCARGKDWSFSRNIKIPQKATVPDNIQGDEDRGNWGRHLHTYLSELYSASETESREIHDQLWAIHNQVHTTEQEAIQCHPNELRDLVRALPPPQGSGNRMVRHPSC